MKPHQNPFQFELGTRVRLVASSERGTVIGRSEHMEILNQYHVRYQAADGRQTECWWSEPALEVDAQEAI